MPGNGFRARPDRLWKACLWSLQGLRSALQHEASFRLELYLALVLVPLGLYLGHDAPEKISLVLPICLVLVAELLNSALETIVDLVSPDFHELAGRAKNLGSAAVFILLLSTVFCWVLVLVPRVFSG